MFLFGVCIGNESKYEAFAAPGLRKHCPHSPVLERRGQSSIFEAYNSILDQARTMPAVEGLVLIHEDTEIRDGQLEDKLREQFAASTVAIVGVIGGRGIRSVR